MTTVRLKAPITGWLTSLTDVPDPAFAQGMIGDGVAIDPFDGNLYSPCDGTVASIQASLHACTIKAENGAEILMHIGVDTVSLNGKGFTGHVTEGQPVKAGDLLISFEMDTVAEGSQSLLTMVLVANGHDGFPIIASPELNRSLSVGDDIFAVEGNEATLPEQCASNSVGQPEETGKAKLMLATGLHARPAAVLSDLARQFASTITIECREKTANARSVVALLALNSAHSDVFTVTASGDDAEEAVNKVCAAIEDGLGDPVVQQGATKPDTSGSTQASNGAVKSAAPLPLLARGEAAIYRGTSAVAGMAVGTAYRLFHNEASYDEAGKGVEIEQARFKSSCDVVAQNLAKSTQTDSEAASIFNAHLSLLEDPELIEGTQALIADGKSAEWAVVTATDNIASILLNLNDAKLAERAADFKDLQGQILAELTGIDPRSALENLPEGTILIADEVFPSEMTRVPNGHLAGVCMVAGGATSHSVILAGSMGIPCIVAVGDDLSRIPAGADVIIGECAGSVSVFPNETALQEAKQAVELNSKRRMENRAHAQQECYLADGTRLEVFANIVQLEDPELAVKEGAEGCGLLRTEFLFLGRDTAPTEEEQLAQYQRVADGMGGRPVIIRTLDAGGDKPLAYLPIPPEENPALGVRGVRATLDNLELFRTQLRAILRVRPFGQCKILVPMITSISELRWVKELIAEESSEIGREVPIEVGAMIEVPAAALTAAKLSEEAEFFSIGTNDLTQYGLAMDRCNPALASSIDVLHPGVLRLIQEVATGASSNNRMVAVCGGAASDLIAAPILVGLGVRELSATPAMIPEVKALLRTLSLKECQRRATLALDCESAEQVRQSQRELETA